MKTVEECVEAIKDHVLDFCSVVYFDKGNGSSGPWKLEIDDVDRVDDLFKDVRCVVEDVKDYSLEFAEAFYLLDIKNFNLDEYDCVLHTVDENGYELFYLIW